MRSFLLSAACGSLLTLSATSPLAGEDDTGKALRQAASDGDAAAVERLLDAGTDPNAATESGGTPLMYAAYGDHAAIVKRLVAAGAEVDRGDRLGDPAINWAAYGGAAAAVEALLDAGADATIATHHGDALAIAMRRGFPEIVASLATRTGTDTGDSPLHLAARNGDMAAVVRGIDAGADVDVENRIGYTPLMEACREGHAEVTRRLLEAGADAAHRGNALGMGMTALHLAADRNQAEIAPLLLSEGLPVDVGNAQGTTPLAWALGEGSKETAIVLLDAGADPSIEDEMDFSAADMLEYLDDEALRRRLEAAIASRQDTPQP